MTDAATPAPRTLDIALHGVTKRFGEMTAVDDLSLDMSVLVQELPSASGSEALRCLEKLLSPPVSASTQAGGA